MFLKKILKKYYFIYVLLAIAIVFIVVDNRSNITHKTQAATISQPMITTTKQNVLSAAETITVSPSIIYLGMWTEGLWDEATQTLHPEKLTNLETLIGKKVAIAHIYRGWEALASPSLLTDLQTLDSHGWRPMISANPYFFDKCQANGQILYKAIATGNCDDFIRSAAQNISKFGKPMFLRFAWEMNINSMEWGVNRTGSSPDDFITAWRHMHDIFASEHAQNVLWVFSPNTEASGSLTYATIYPGDDYVDWLGLDGYNWGNTQAWSTWQTFEDVFSASYSHIHALAPAKPIMLAETNTTDQRGDKPAWYLDMLQKQLPTNFPQVQAVVFYNEDRTVKEGVNWLITSSDQALKAFKLGIQASFYRSSF